MGNRSVKVLRPTMSFAWCQGLFEVLALFEKAHAKVEAE